MRLWKAHGLGNDYLVWEGDADFLTPQNVKKYVTEIKVSAVMVFWNPYIQM